MAALALQLSADQHLLQELELGLVKRLRWLGQLGEGDPQEALLLDQPLPLCRRLLRLQPPGEAGALEARRLPALQLQRLLRQSWKLAQGRPLQLRSLTTAELLPRKQAPQLQRAALVEEEQRPPLPRRKQHRLKKPRPAELRKGAPGENKVLGDPW